MSHKIFKAGIGIAAAIALIAPAAAGAATLYRQLDSGAQGSDVSALQTYLAQDSSLYPEGLVTGYYGSLTAAAVSRYQTRHGLPAVGRVGPMTLASLNAVMDTADASKIAPTISGVSVNPSRTSASVAWSTNEAARGTVFYSDSPLAIAELPNSVIVSGTSTMADANFHSSQNLTLQDLRPGTTYYYLIDVVDADGNVSVTWPSTFSTSSY